jgi:transposase
MGRSRGGLTTKLHAIVDAQGRPIRLMLIGGQVHDSHGVRELLVDLDSGTIVVGHKAYDADWIRAHVKDQGAVANIPNKANRTHRYRWKKALSRERNVIERFFNRIKHYRRLATRYEKLGANFLAMVQHALVRLWLREIESTT